MNTRKLPLFLLRISLGWYYLYAGYTKLINPNWSAKGYLGNAKSLQGFYTMLSQPKYFTTINFVNKWGLFLLGVSLILGLMVLTSTILGAVLMVLYYFPVLDFPGSGGAWAIDRRSYNFCTSFVSFSRLPCR